LPLDNVLQEFNRNLAAELIREGGTSLSPSLKKSRQEGETAVSLLPISASRRNNSHSSSHVNDDSVRQREEIAFNERLSLLRAENARSD
jgi:hypothetical protein